MSPYRDIQAPVKGEPASPERPVDIERALVEETVRLCTIASVTGNEEACAAYVEAALRKTPFGVERVGETVLACSPGSDPRPLVLLVGHTDTVPPKPGDGAPGVVGERIVGLGASDMKSGLAVMLELARRLDPDALPYRVGFVFYDKEEGPWAISGLGPALVKATWLRDAALAFCLEPSDNIVQMGCLGSLHAKVTLHGRAAHSARPWQGESAIHAAGHLLVALGDRAPRDFLLHGHLYREVISATLISGGRTRNVVPDRCEINLNFRFAPGRTLEDAESELRTFVAAVVAVPFEIEFAERAPSGRVIGDNALLTEFLRLNGNAVAAKQAWTDVARLAQVGIDAVNLGPGESAQAHQANESTGIALIVESYRQFEGFLRGVGRNTDGTANRDAAVLGEPRFR